MSSLKAVRVDACVIKRIYVRPGYRGNQIGRTLLVGLIQDARNYGYSTILLDSALFMRASHGLDYSAAFQETEPYPEAELPKEFYDHIVFRSRDL